MPPGALDRYSDSKPETKGQTLHGFGLPRVLRDGRSVWLAPVAYEIPDRSTREAVVLWRLPGGLSLAQARKLRDDARAWLAAGEDPGEVKKEEKRQKLLVQQTTFAKLAEAYKAKAEKEGRADATQIKTEWLLGMEIDAFVHKSIAEGTSPVVLACLRKVEAKGNHETAKQLRAKIGADGPEGLAA